MGGGDFVLVKRPTVASLDVPTRPHILQVVRLKESGVVVLQGQDGVQIEEQHKNVVLVVCQSWIRRYTHRDISVEIRPAVGSAAANRMRKLWYFVTDVSMHFIHGA